MRGLSTYTVPESRRGLPSLVCPTGMMRVTRSLQSVVMAAPSKFLPWRMVTPVSRSLSGRIQMSKLSRTSRAPAWGTTPSSGSSRHSTTPRRVYSPVTLWVALQCTSKP